MITYPDNSTVKYSYYENGDLMYEIDQMNRQTFYMYENYESYQENGVTKYRSRLTKIVKPARARSGIYKYKSAGQIVCSNQVMP